MKNHADNIGVGVVHKNNVFKMFMRAEKAEIPADEAIFPLTHSLNSCLPNYEIKRFIQIS